MNIVSINFKNNKKNYYFKSDFDLEVDDEVVVQTTRGSEFAYVNMIDVDASHIPFDQLQPVIRKATKKDQQNYQLNQKDAQKALDKFKEIVDSFPDLVMNVVNSEYNLDRTRLLFTYISDERVDFRELLKVLASVFKTRIELKQIGARDKAKLIGGLGPCGMETCCTRFLKDFDNISINMAKNQYLSLNPLKISGLCGRLLCCLNYENDLYSEAKKLFPKIGKLVEYKGSKYKVSGVNIITEEVKLENYQNVIFVGREELEW